MVEIKPGQSVTLDLQMSFDGVCGQDFLRDLTDPVIWTSNASIIGASPTLTPSGDGLSCVLSIPDNNTNYGSFVVTATSGDFVANLDIDLQEIIPCVKVLKIIAGTPE